MPQRLECKRPGHQANVDSEAGTVRNLLLFVDGQAQKVQVLNNSVPCVLGSSNFSTSFG